MLRRGSGSEEVESEVGPSASLSAAKAAAGPAAAAPPPDSASPAPGGDRGGRDTPTPGKRRPPHRHSHQRRSRLSPEGREREFPATRVGQQVGNLIYRVTQHLVPNLPLTLM